MRKKIFLVLGSAVLAASVSMSMPIGTTQAAEFKGGLKTSNVLGIPLRPGKIQLSCPFLRVTATITKADMDSVVFTSNYKNVTIQPNAHRPSGITLDFGSDRMNGSIEKGHNQTVLSLDNIGKFTISMKDTKTFVISGGLPFNINVTWVD